MKNKEMRRIDKRRLSLVRVGFKKSCKFKKTPNGGRSLTSLLGFGVRKWVMFDSE